MYTDIINNSLLVESYSTVTDNFSVITEKIHEYFPEHNFRIVTESGSGSITYGNNESLLLSQEIFNDYIFNDYNRYEYLMIDLWPTYEEDMIVKMEIITIMEL